MSRISRWMVVSMVLVLVSSFSVMAQDTPEMPPLPGELVVGDLGGPRGVAFDEDGNLIVAVAGTGGESQVTIASPEGDTTLTAGLTGRIIAVDAEGTVTDWVSGLPSYATEMETTGVYRAIPQGDSLWVVYSGTGSASTGAFWTDSVVELDAETLATKRVINLNNIEATQDPDGAGYDTNVADIAWGSDGTLYIVNAGQNDLLSWTEADGLQVVHAWTDNSVPTSIEVAENGDIYVGFLGAGLAPNAGKIEHWSNGELVETFGNLNTITDILLDGETLYAVQLTVFGEQGPGPGSVITVNADGVTMVAEGLMAPFGIAKGPDGDLYVSFGTIAFMPGMTGGVVKIDI